MISFTLANPGELVSQAHNVGSRVMVQITTVAQAVQGAERGVDVIIAQGERVRRLSRRRQHDGARAAGRRCDVAHSCVASGGILTGAASQRR